MGQFPGRAFIRHSQIDLLIIVSDCHLTGPEETEDKVSETPKPNAGFSLELGPEVANITCDHCGKVFKSVHGYIKKDNWAYSVYFATLQTGHDDITVGLSLSIGKWWDDSAVDERSWVYLPVLVQPHTRASWNTFFHWESLKTTSR